MKKLLSILSFALFSVSAFAGIYRHAAKPAAKASAKVLGFSASKTYQAGKISSYPVRHPVKSVKASAKAAKKVVY